MTYWETMWQTAKASVRLTCSLKLLHLHSNDSAQPAVELTYGRKEGNSATLKSGHPRSAASSKNSTLAGQWDGKAWRAYVWCRAGAQWGTACTSTVSVPVWSTSGTKKNQYANLPDALVNSIMVQWDRGGEEFDLSMANLKFSAQGITKRVEWGLFKKTFQVVSCSVTHIPVGLS